MLCFARIVLAYCLMLMPTYYFLFLLALFVNVGGRFVVPLLVQSCCPELSGVATKLDAAFDSKANSVACK